MTCYALETEYRSGVRFIPVRVTDGLRWLHTQFVADTAEEALESAILSDERELGPEWAAENVLVGVAEVRLEIVNFQPRPLHRCVTLWGR